MVGLLSYSSGCKITQNFSSQQIFSQKKTFLMQILLVSTRYSYFIPNLDCKILNIYETPANNSE